MIRYIKQFSGNSAIGNLSRAVTAALLLSLAACGGGGGEPGDEDSNGGIFGTGLQLNGTVSTRFALAQDAVEYKRQSGERGTETVTSNGTFEADEVPGSGAVLLRTTTNNGDMLYAIALPEESNAINQNVHSYSDLVARNWFASNGQDINAAFDSSGNLTNVPSATALAALEQSVSQIYSGVEEDYNIQGANIFNDVFLANGTGIDEFLTSNPVLINNGVINIFFVDPSTNTQSQATTAVNLNSNLTIDSESPTAPTGIRALPASGNEVLVVWNPALDNIAVTRYDVYRNGTLLDSTPYPVYSDMTVSPGTPFTYFVIAVDSSANQSNASLSVTAETVFTPDTVAPAAVTDLLLEPAVSSIALTWMHENSSDVASFIVSRSEGTSNLAEYLSVTSPALTDLNVIAGTQYCYEVTAVDGSGNASMPSEVRCAIANGEVVVTDPVPTVTPDNTTPDNTNNGNTVTIGTEGALTLGSCGAQISPAIISGDIDAPTILTQGQVVFGEVDANNGLEDNYWTFDVPAGDYSLVVEPFTASRESTNILMQFIETDSRGIEVAQLVGFNEVDSRVREVIPVTVDANGFSLKAEISPSGRTQGYHIALYSLADAIPSPFLADCPPLIQPATVGTTEAFSLDEGQEQYFLIDLPAGDYEMLVDTTVTDGSNTNIIYRVFTSSLSNRISSQRQIESANEVDSFFRSVITFEIETAGQFYFRWNNPRREYNFEFTITRL